MLLLLYKNGGRLSKSNIYDYFNAPKSKVEEIIRTLCSKRYIKVVNDEIYLTPLGRVVIKELIDLLSLFQKA